MLTCSNVHPVCTLVARGNQVRWDEGVESSNRGRRWRGSVQSRPLHDIGQGLGLTSSWESERLWRPELRLSGPWLARMIWLSRGLFSPQRHPSSMIHNETTTRAKVAIDNSSDFKMPFISSTRFTHVAK